MNHHPLPTHALREFQAIVGDAHVAVAAPADSVGDRRPELLVHPGSIDEVSAALRLATRMDLAVVPRGSGTKIQWGAPPSRADVVLSMARLDRLLDHAAGDMVVTVEAGSRLGAVRQHLALERQWIPLDPAAGGTLGGIVATNAAGPRRLRYGLPRDLLIGITVVLADGTVAHAGGRVVKNVAGYDLAKLFAGSFGTLGVIVQATFRLHPLAECSRNVRGEVDTERQAADVVRAITQSTLTPTALELCWPGDGGAGLLFALFEGVEPAVNAQAAQAARTFEECGASARISSVDDETWRAIFGPTVGENRVLAKIVASPADLEAVLDLVLGATRRHALDARLYGHAAIGVLYLELDPADRDAARHVVQAVRAGLERRDARLILLHAPPDLKRQVGTWGSPGDALDLMRRVKERFDPTGIMSPGRFMGGI